MGATIVYQVFIQSFCDSNGDGIGDIPGLIAKLDYIADLGATTIWIMPVHPSPSYHKYDVTDHYAIHPDYGTTEDMERLIHEVHRRDMKIILDLVVNHTSSQHPWFLESKKRTQNPYRDFYVWRDTASIRDEIVKKTMTIDSDNVTLWHEVEGLTERYYGYFGNHMPDFNFDLPAVREEIFRAAKYWLAKGIDGYRLDAAKHIYPDERADDTRMFWIKFRNEMVKTKSDIRLVGEVWSDPETISSYFSGIPSLFNFELAKSIPESIQSRKPGHFIATYTRTQEAYHRSGYPFEDAIFLSNHDMDRICSILDHDQRRAKLAASMLLTLPGTPYIYYGEEIGMRGKKPDPQIREPFLWNEAGSGHARWIDPVHSTSTEVDAQSKQATDPDSIYHHYKTWIKIRKQHSAMTDGEIVFVQSLHADVLAYIRSDSNEKLLVMHNLSDQDITIKIPAGVHDWANGNQPENEIRISPFCSTFIILEQ